MSTERRRAQIHRMIGCVIWLHRMPSVLLHAKADRDNATVGILDLLALLANWGACA